MKKLVHEAFEVGITLKFIDGILEIIGTAVVLLIPPTTIAAWLRSLFAHEFEFSTYSQWFTALYLFTHGIVKVFIVICLWQRRLWAYPLAIGIFVAFGIYQSYLYSHSHSILMLALTILDIIIIWLTYQEYQSLKSKPL